MTETEMLNNIKVINEMQRFAKMYVTNKRFLSEIRREEEPTLIVINVLEKVVQNENI